MGDVAPPRVWCGESLSTNRHGRCLTRSDASSRCLWQFLGSSPPSAACGERVSTIFVRLEAPPGAQRALRCGDVLGFVWQFRRCWCHGCGLGVCLVTSSLFGGATDWLHPIVTAVDCLRAHAHPLATSTDTTDAF
jgi:hypothetical protein